MNCTNVICRLCCKIIHDHSEEPVDDIMIEMLEILLKPNLDATQGSVICKECKGHIESSFNFKSICLHTEDFLTPFLENNDAVDVKDVYHRVMKEKSTIYMTQNVCRLCMNPIEGNDCVGLNEGKDICSQTMLAKCLPELNLKATVDISICNSCMDSLQRSYNFLETCSDTDEKIRTYINSTKLNVNGETKLKNALAFIAAKKYKYSDDEQGSRKFCKVKENIEDIKDCNIKLETELEFDEEFGSITEHSTLNEQDDPTEEMHVCLTCGYSTKVQDILRDHALLHKGHVKRHSCHLCTYETDYLRDLKRHFISHQTVTEATVYQCFHCPYKTKYLFMLSSHIAGHKANGYKCETCEYHTLDKRNFSNHMKRHLGRSSHPPHKVKCAHCSFKARTKVSLAKHLLSHKQPAKETELFYCDQCPFKSKYHRSLLTHKKSHGEARFECFHCQTKFKLKSYLINHLESHRPKEQRKIYQCSQCDYKTICRTTLDNHRKRHNPQAKVQTFTCAICSYTTANNAKLRAHAQTHMSKSEAKTHKCPECDYVTIWRYNLKHHALKHRADWEVTMHKCPHCSYRTKYEGYLKYHVRGHEDAQPELLRCAQCDFRTKIKGNLVKHVNAKHVPTEATTTFSCDLCDYVTRYKGNLKSHRNTHQEETAKYPYRCAQCAYHTKHKAALYRHVKCHRNVETYTCDFCGIVIRHGSNFKRHLVMCVERKF